MLSKYTRLLYRAVEWLYDWSNVYFIARYRHVFGNLPPCHKGTTLEVGCGDSLLWTSRLAARSRLLIAMDLAGDRARNAKQLASRPHSQLQNVAWVVADVVAMPFRSGCLEAVTCIDVIEHIPDHHTAMSEIARVITDCGKAVVTTMHENRPHYLYPVVFADHVREYTPESLEQLCHEGRMRVVKHFSFYKPLTMVMRELQGVIPRFKLPLVTLLVRLPVALLAYVGEIDARPGGGIGVVIEPC